MINHLEEKLETTDDGRRDVPDNTQRDSRVASVERLVESAFRARLGAENWQASSQKWYWDAKEIGVEKSTLFHKLSPDAQEMILSEVSQMYLGEAYFIEDAGMRYAAQMNLAAHSQQERMFYALMSGEEASHLRMIIPYMKRIPSLEEQPFAAYIGHIIDQGSRESLLLLIQIALEGWGLNHYSKLAKGCRDTGLSSVLRQILKDEARHHGMGLVLGSYRALSPTDQSFVIECFSEILNAVRAGPVGILNVIDRATGGISTSERQVFLEQTRAHLESQMKLDLLKSLIRSCLDEKAMSFLDSRGLFKV